MSIIELRKKIIEKINETDNIDLLLEVSRLLNLPSKEVEIYKLSTNQKKAINQARAQIKNGQFLKDEDANKEINEFLFYNDSDK